MMTKREAAALFGGKDADLARALGMTRAGIWRWPAELTSDQQDRVLGAAIRLGKPIPERFRKPRDGNGAAARNDNRTPT